MYVRCTPAVRAAHELGLLQMFLFFFPVTLLQSICDWTNKHARAVGTENKYNELKVVELVKMLGLVILRSLRPAPRLVHHWKGRNSHNVEGVQPPDNFGAILSYKRFNQIWRFIRFHDPENFDAEDRGYRMRRIIDTMNERFQLGMTIGSFISFDEAMIPLFSRYCPIRCYIRGKPHPWGIKVYMSCCATTAYTYLLDLSVGKEVRHGKKTKLYVKSGPTALLKNMKKIAEIALVRQNLDVLKSKIVVVTDRFFTSIEGTIQLLRMGFYTIGTIAEKKFGLPQLIVDAKKSLKERGDFRVFELIGKGVRVSLWKDSKIIPFVSTGISTKTTNVQRRVREKGKDSKYRRTRKEIPTTFPVKIYNDDMAGVDRHDEYRMMYSVQKAFKFRKWFKQAFLGLFDMMLVNMFIVLKQLQDGCSNVTHYDFLRQLAVVLIHVTQKDLDNRQHTRPTRTASHNTPQAHRPKPTPSKSASGTKLHSVQCACPGATVQLAKN